MRARRRRSAIGIDIWPGFVDALASLLMVVIFLLMVFALAQHFLSDALSGRDEALAAATVRADTAEAERDEARIEAAALGQALIKANGGLQQAALDAVESAHQAAELEDALAAAIKRASETLARLERTEAKLNQAETAGEAATANATALSASLAALQAEARSLKAALVAKSAESADQATALAASAASIASLEATLSALRTSTVALEASLAAKTQESKAQMDALVAAQTDRKGLRQTISNLERAIAALEADNQALTAETTEHQTALNAAAAERQALGLELMALELRIAKLKADLATSSTETETVAALADVRAGEIEQLRSQLQQRGEEAAVEIKRLTNALATAEAARDAAAALAAERFAALTALGAAKTSADDAAQATLDAVEKRLAALETDLAAAQRQLGASEGRREALQEQVTALTQALEAARREGETAASAREALAARLAERSAANAKAVTEYRARIKALEAEISDLNGRARALQEAADAAETGLIAARKAATGLEAERDTIIDERKRIAGLNAELQAKVDQLNAALDAALTDAKARGATILQLRGKLNSALAAKVSELKRYRSDFFARLSDVLGDRDDIRVVGDRFVLQSEVLFATAKAELGPAGQASINAVARSLSDIVRTIPADVDWVLRVDGHTDQRPIANEQFPSNWELSTARAVAVVRALAESGIPANRLVAAGFGQHHPIDRAKTAAADRRNRRIEFKLTTR